MSITFIGEATAAVPAGVMRCGQIAMVVEADDREDIGDIVLRVPNEQFVTLDGQYVRTDAHSFKVQLLPHGTLLRYSDPKADE